MRRMNLYIRKIFNLRSKHNFLFPLLLVLLTIILTTKGIDSGEFWVADEGRHAMDGVFILDFMKDLPFDDVYGYSGEILR